MTQPIVALQMDSLAVIKAESDTTVALALEAMSRGYRLFAYTPDALSYEKGQIVARGNWVSFKDQFPDFYTHSNEALLPLKDARFVLMRQDPPFNMAYIAATHFLDLLPSTTRVINDPTGVRNSPEKLLVTLFPDLMPPTLMSWDQALIVDFIKTHGTVVLKPIFDYGGNGILVLNAGDPNLKGILEMYQQLYETPPIFQKFLPQIKDGDRRILLIEGKPVGIFKRVPPPGEIRSNMRVGGVPQICEFSPRDLEICTRIGPVLKERGLYLAGIDVIGDYLTEINVTSPTGVRTLKQLYDVDVSKEFWDGLE
jgi:glutathione synthase